MESLFSPPIYMLLNHTQGLRTSLSKDSFEEFWDQIKMRNLLTLPESIKFIKITIALMDPLLMLSENLFCIALPLIGNRVKNLQKSKT